MGTSKSNFGALKTAICSYCNSFQIQIPIFKYYFAGVHGYDKGINYLKNVKHYMCEPVVHSYKK